MNDWDINPSKYLTDSEGNFKLKADGTPRKKGGRPKGSKSRGYNYHSQTKAKLAARKQVRIKEKQIEQTRNKLNALRNSANTSKEVLAKLDDKESSTTGKIVYGMTTISWSNLYRNIVVIILDPIRLNKPQEIYLRL